MRSHQLPILPRTIVHLSMLVLLLAVPALLRADDQKSPAASGQPLKGELTKEDRIDILRTFTADLTYVRTVFPMGKTGLSLKDGKITPSGDDLRQDLALWGPSVKPGDQVLISLVAFKGDRIRFEINGGPVKRKKWYQHIEVGMGGDTQPVAPSDSNSNPRGSYVDLVFDHHIPDINAKRVQELLQPVFDFNSKSGVDAYLESVPPIVQKAIKAHQVLVGMNREMVLYSKGQAPKKIREKDSTGTEYEEWIYGEPPQDVDFVRFVGDEVVRVENMKVDGQKTVKTQKEVDLEPSEAAKAAEPSKDAAPPTLRRPGEPAPADPQINPRQNFAREATTPPDLLR
ncbi:MAG TPA: hypothetical protein VGG46_10560 [Terriglobales bacterium]|jgi:hypothetical protein